MTFTYPRSAKDIMDAQKSRLHRQDGEIASLQLDIEDLERDLEERTAERDRARAIAVELEQQLAAVFHQLRKHIESRQDDHARHPGDINAAAVLAAEAALKWAEVGDWPVYKDDQAEEAAF